MFCYALVMQPFFNQSLMCAEKNVTDVTYYLSRTSMQRSAGVRVSSFDTA